MSPPLHIEHKLNTKGLNMNTTKICSKCKTEKSISEFHKQKDKKDGLRSNCKQCLREYALENKEKINKQKRENYKKNHKYIIAKKRKYRNDNKEKIKLNQKKYYQDNKDKLLNNQKEYYKNNTDTIKETKKTYYNKNKKMILEKNKMYIKTKIGRLSRKNTEHRRRLELRNGNVTTKQLQELYNNTTNCYWCGCKLKKNDTHLDHYIPIAKGGKHTIDNLVLSCSKCNLTKGAKDPFEFALEKGKLF